MTTFHQLSACYLPEQYSRRDMLRLSRSILVVGTPALLLGFIESAAAAGDQNAWRFCGKCHTLFYDGFPNKGRCPAGGGHVAQGYDFVLQYDDNRRRAQTQYDWRFCNKCHAMFFDGFPNKGNCPASGGHVAQGFMFGLYYTNESSRTPPTGGRFQPAWRFCGKCHTMFYDGYPNKGRCQAGGGHAAAGWAFHLPYRDTSPQGIVSEALQTFVNQNRGQIENEIKRWLGTGDLIARGVTLYKINFRLGSPNFRYTTGTNFEYRLDHNYMYCRSTTPTAAGSWGDPAFELHFGLELTGALVIPSGAKPRVERTVLRVPRIIVKPRNVVGGVVTTIVHFFQQTENGKRRIQDAADKYLRRDITEYVNAQLRRIP